MTYPMLQLTKKIPIPVGGEITGKYTFDAGPAEHYSVYLNTTPEPGDKPAQQWIIVG